MITNGGGMATSQEYTKLKKLVDVASSKTKKIILY